MVPDITDDELAELAMAADPDAPIADDAVPFGTADDAAMPLLPGWYMPAPRGRATRGRAIVFTVVVGSLLVGNIAGFCVTNGFPEFVW